MFIKSRLLQFLVPVLLLTIVAGCSDSGTKSNNTDNNLTDDFGGYKPTNESPAFGDPTIMSMNADVDAEDEIGSSSLVDSLNNAPNRNIYSVELAWGHLQYDSSETAVTDWSGSLSVKRGAIVAIRLIGFEAGDHIVRPRNSAKELQWVSHTREHFDGMLVYVYDPRVADSAAPNGLTFATTPFTRTFEMSELDSISEIVNVGSNQFSINAFKVERLECGEGFLDGKWMRNADDDKQGKFMGRWISKDGVLWGHFKGHFGVREDGSHLLFGKWISAQHPGDNDPPGTFRGLLRGEWDVYDPADSTQDNRGWFRGDIFNRELTKIGRLEGHWVAVAPHMGAREGMGGMNSGNGRKGHGFVRGQWFEICN